MFAIFSNLIFKRQTRDMKQDRVPDLQTSVSRLTFHVSRTGCTNKRQENFVKEFLRLLVQLRPNNKQIRLWRKVKPKSSQMKALFCLKMATAFTFTIKKK
jgi:hypothetical protein